MAITIESLIGDIEKKLDILGVEDYEELHSPDWDIPSLKEYKANVDTRVKEYKAALKKEKDNSSDLRDFFVKLGRVFKDDVYIYNGKYVYPGHLSTDSLAGHFLLETTAKYEDVLIKNLYSDLNKNRLIYIPSIDSMKKSLTKMEGEKSVDLSRALSEMRVDIENTDIGKSVIDNIKNMLSNICDDADMFITIPEQSDPEVFSIKKVFRLEYPNCPDVEINLQLLPTVSSDKSSSNLEDVEYMCSGMNDTGGNIPLYYVRFKITFSYFNIHIKYSYF